jgi:ESS family glutamate:Na+ symporter
MIIVNLIVNFYFGWKVFDDDWFERTLGSYGLESGVLATGLMLLRVVDPKFETTGQESAAASAALCYPWSLPYIMIMPALCFSLSPWIILGISAALLVVFLVIARVFFWHSDRKFSDILNGKSSSPVQNQEELK